MEARKSDVVVVSAFGRGNWLASVLAAEGFSTSLVDVSECMGRWAPEDWEGPFGYFHHEGLTSSQVARLTEDDDAEGAASGFTIWLKKGPLDLKGPVSSYLLEKQGVPEAVREYILKYQSQAEASLKVGERLKHKSFQETWLAHLAHQLAANAYLPNSAGLSYGRPLPLFSPFFVRRVSRRGYQKALDLCESNGVRVYKQAKITDLQVENRRLTAMEIGSNWSGVLESDHWVWGLSSHESARLNEKVWKTLFPKGALVSQWSWMRYRMQLSEGPYLEVLPIQFVFINDLCLPWTHTNMMVAQRGVINSELDVWLRIPTHQRFRKSYLEALEREIVEAFSERLPHANARIKNMPQEHIYDEQALGPSRFPVYELTKLKHLQRARFKNISYDGPECWSSMDWSGQFRSQNKIFGELKTWRQQQRKKTTEAEDDRALHP